MSKKFLFNKCKVLKNSIAFVQMIVSGGVQIQTVIVFATDDDDQSQLNDSIVFIT